MKTKLIPCAAISAIVIGCVSPFDTKPPSVKAESPSLRASRMPFKLGFAGYTFHKDAVDSALAKLKRIDAHYLCIKPNLIDYMQGAGAPIAEFKAKCAAAGVECLAAGPLYFDNEADARRIFEFAKAYGIGTVVVVPFECNPNWKDGMPEREHYLESDRMMDILEKLCREFDIRAAVHNHGPDNAYLYPTAESALKRIGGRDRRIGVCLDVGHERRAGLDPAEFIRSHGDRIYDVHLKNIKIDPVKNYAKEGPRGELDIAGIFRALAEVGYTGVCHIEYEKDFEDNLAEIAESFGYYRGLMDEVADRVVRDPAPAGGFSHGLSGTKPWTNENFLDDPQEFHFAIIGDRTGGERPGFFGKTMESLNLLRPEFTICVGDLVAGGGVSEPALRKQWAEATDFISRLEMPFFHVVGNHDIWTGITGRSPARQTAIDVWKELHGTNTYYSFTYKNCLFLSLDVMEEAEYFPPREPVPQHQLDWAVGEFEKHRDVRWRFIFMHKPLDWTSDRWLAFEKRIAQYDYTVFCGDWHNFCTADRNGKRYYMLGTCGGGWDCGVKHEDLRYGIMDAITWVTVTKKGPKVSYVRIGGIHGDTVQTSATTQGWVEAPLDRPSHRAENPAQYAGEKNSALIPTEVMQGPGYDWHFRHAIILRTGRCLPVGYETLPKGKRVILLGDETATDRASDYGAGWCTIDMGFKGDRIENVLWRVIEGELLGYEPQKVVISVGKHNKCINTSEEIAAGLKKLEGYVRARVPFAEIEVVRY